MILHNYSFCMFKSKVYFQDSLIQTNSFDKYIQLYYPDEKKYMKLLMIDGKLVLFSNLIVNFNKYLM